MKLSKLLSMILGLSGFSRMGVVGGDGGGAMSFHDAGAAFAAMGDDSAGSGGGEEETDEAAAERLAAEDAHGATQQADADTEETTAAADDNDTLTIEVDGKEVALKKSDLPELYKGNLRQKDYTQKTMAAAETQRAADAEITKARAERDKYAQELSNFAITATMLQAEQQKVLTDELFNSDPVEYMAQERIFNKRQADLAKAQAELQRIQGEYQQEQQAAHQQFLKDQYAAMVERFPEWKDPKQAEAAFMKLNGFMSEQGFNEKDGRIILDARLMTLAHDAMKYRDLMARAKESKAKVAAAPPKVERPGVAKVDPTDGRTKQMKQLEKTGSVRDAGAIFANFV